ncbi:MAG TPA: LysR family transcriptional regulator [Candidatus Baltobacteraceae bacterium]|nr:LysR family transcriptional regulator [Candidatus Baltobacteraceae bacterium]
MSMELRNLSSFLAVAKVLSFTRAAQELNYSQSTVTAQIQNLEREIGSPLFERLGKRVTLTDSGRRLIRYAEKMIGLEREALTVVSGDSEPAGAISIGACEWLCGDLLPRTIRTLRTRYPLVALSIRAGACIDLRNAVSDGVLDVALLVEPKVRLPEITVDVLESESLVILAPPDHRLASRRRIRPTELGAESWLVMRTGCSTLDLLFKAIIAAGGSPGPVIEFGSFEAIKRCVAAGVGLTLAMHSVVRSEIEAGSLTELSCAVPPTRMYVQMVRHRDKWLSPALASFFDAVREEVSQMPWRGRAPQPESPSCRG